MISASVMLATIIHALDSTIANVALPHIQGSLSATLDQVSWVLTSYVVASAVAMPLVGFLALRFGRKRLLLGCVTGFTLMSMLCGAAQSLPQLIAFRVLQGAFGAGLVPISQMLLLDVYPRERHPQAMAMWGVGVMIGPILGPLIGGYLTENYSWRWVFYINLPVGGLALLGIIRYVAEKIVDKNRPFDFFGFFLLSMAIGVFQIMLDRGESQDWFNSYEIIIEAGLAALCLYLLIVHTLTAEKSFVAPALFKDRNFTIGLGISFFAGMVMLSTVALVPPMMHDLLGYPVIDTGLVMMPRGIGMMITMILVGRLSGKVDVRVMLLVGFALIGMSLWQMTAFSLSVGAWELAHTGFTQGLGLGFIFVTSSAATFSTLPTQFRAEGTAIYSVMRNIGGSIGVSVVVAAFTSGRQGHHAFLAEKISPYRPSLNIGVLPAPWDWSTTRGLALLEKEVARQAAMSAYLDVYVLVLIATITIAPLVCLIRVVPPAPAAAVKN